MSSQKPQDRVRLTHTSLKPPFVSRDKPIEGPTVWYGADLAPADVEYRLTDADLAELDAAVRQVEVSGRNLEDVGKEEFPLPTLGPLLELLHRDVLFGRGLQLLRGLPTQQEHGLKYAVTALWGISAYFGDKVALTQAGHLLGHVRDAKSRIRAAGGGRTNLGTHPMGFHNDNADIVFLACLQNAASGGENRCCSTHALRNEILERRPDLHEVLSEPFYQDRHDWIPEGQPPHYISPVFHYHGNSLGVEAAAANAGDFAGTPGVTDIQREALAFVQEVAAEARLVYEVALQPGDVLLNHNLTTFHSRTPITDEGAAVRHMLRLWISSPLGWDIDPMYEQRWFTTERGRRGGLVCPGNARWHVALSFEQYVQELLDWYAEHPLATTVGLRRAGLLPLKPGAPRKEFAIIDNTNGVDSTTGAAQEDVPKQRSQEQLHVSFGRSVGVSA